MRRALRVPPPGVSPPVSLPVSLFVFPVSRRGCLPPGVSPPVSLVSPVGVSSPVSLFMFPMGVSLSCVPPRIPRSEPAPASGVPTRGDFQPQAELVPGGLSPAGVMGFRLRARLLPAPDGPGGQRHAPTSKVHLAPLPCGLCPTTGVTVGEEGGFGLCAAAPRVLPFPGCDSTPSLAQARGTPRSNALGHQRVPSCAGAGALLYCGPRCLQNFSLKVLEQ